MGPDAGHHPRHARHPHHAQHGLLHEHGTPEGDEAEGLPDATRLPGILTAPETPEGPGEGLMGPSTVAFVPAELEATGEHRGVLGATPTVDELLAATRATEGRPRAAEPHVPAADEGLTLLATTAPSDRPTLLATSAVPPATATPAPPSTAPPASTTATTAPAVAAAPAAPAAGVPEAREPAPRRRHRGRVVGVAALVLVVAVVVAGAIQLRRPVPAPRWHGTVRLEATAPGGPPALPWPAKGEAAVSVPSVGVTVASGPERAVPIASLAKIMTAYLTLRDHPLAPDAQGPSVVMTAVDQEEAYEDDAQGATSVPVVPGERLTERQLLDGLMVHSANNLADTLARWDAGSVPAFVADMNRTAAALGMRATHYADADGLDPATVGTPADQLRLADLAMADPTFAAVVAQTSVTLPLAGTLPSYVQSVGSDGIVGVKSGFTQAAMGCLVMAAQRTVDGHDVLVLAAVTGQPGDDPLGTANAADLALVNAVARSLVEVPVLGAGTAVGSVSALWASHAVTVRAAAGASVLAWPGQRVGARMVPGTLRAPLEAGARVGTVEVGTGAQRVQLAARLTGPVARPSMGWRLLRG